MKRVIVLSALLGCGATPGAPTATPATVAGPIRPPFDPVTGELGPPRDYRAWPFLTSGFQMSYGPAAIAANAGGVDAYDSVFVDPAAHAAFLTSGVWPDRTMFVLEIRTAEHTGSIVTHGHYQTDLLGIEAEIKDARIPGGWGYFAFAADATGPVGPAKRLPSTAACYGCHAVSAAVENTFTQFYPTLFPIAVAHHTVRADFVGIPPSVTEVHDRIVAGGIAAGRALIDATTAKWPEATIVREISLNRIGYMLVAEKRIALAIEVFADLTRRFPSSANAWDSYAETLEAAGKQVEALDATHRGLAVIDALPAGGQRDAIAKALRDRAARLGP